MQPIICCTKRLFSNYTINFSQAIVTGTNRKHDTSHGRTNVVQTNDEKKMINTAKKMIKNCNAFSSEEYCLQAIFGSQYFWNK